MCPLMGEGQSRADHAQHFACVTLRGLRRKGNFVFLDNAADRSSNHHAERNTYPHLEKSRASPPPLSLSGLQFEDNDRAILEGGTEGFVKIHVKRGTDRIIGATIVGDGAGDMIRWAGEQKTVACLGRSFLFLSPFPTAFEAITCRTFLSRESVVLSSVGRAHASLLDLALSWTSCSFRMPSSLLLLLLAFNARQNLLAGCLLSWRTPTGVTHPFPSLHLVPKQNATLLSCLCRKSRHNASTIPPPVLAPPPDSEISVAMQSKVGLGALAGVIHPYPTRAESIRQAGDLYNKTKLTPVVRSLFRNLMAIKR